MPMKINNSDLAISIGALVLLVFFHLASMDYSISARTADPRPVLHKQGEGAAYEYQVDDRLGVLENTARTQLYEIGSAEYSYASRYPDNRFTYLQDLVYYGYLQPNATGATLAPGYSITFYLPGERGGFTAVAEPTNIELRPLLIDENYQVIVLTPSADNDPDDEWKSVREFMNEYWWDNGRFIYPGLIQLASWDFDQDLEVRINRENSLYVIHRMGDHEILERAPDDSIMYSYQLRAYMLGDVRSDEEIYGLDNLQ